MRKHVFLLVVAAALVSALAATGDRSAEAGATAAAGRGARLQSFGTCPRLLSYAKQHALPLVGAWGLGGPAGGVGAFPAVGAPAAGDAKSSGSAGVDYSTTNVQEEGVDEPDIVKSDGSHLFVVRSDRLFAVDVRGLRPKLAGSVQLPAGYGYELLLHGNRLLVLSHGGGVAIGMPPQVGVSRSMPFYAPQSSLIEIDVRNPSELRIVRSMVLDADYVTARLVGSVVRVVTASSMPQPLPFVAPDETTPAAAAVALAKNRAVVRTSRITSWLPSYAVKGRRGETLAKRSSSTVGTCADRSCTPGSGCSRSSPSTSTRGSHSSTRAPCSPAARPSTGRRRASTSQPSAGSRSRSRPVTPTCRR